MDRRACQPNLDAPNILVAYAAVCGNRPSAEHGGGRGCRAPDPSLTDIERRQMTIDNLTRILQALEAYRMEKGTYPGFAIHSDSGQPLLSWRVELLPYLGYPALYDQFRRDQPWDSAHNRALLTNIPAVYQSPDRFDRKTNYVVPVGRSTAFSGARGNHPRRWEDGLENIVVLLEVDDSAAVFWTAPDDWAFDPASPSRSLGKLRADGFFAGWGGGSLARIPTETAVTDLRAMFTVDGGEPFEAASISRAATAQPAATQATADASPIPSSIPNNSPSSAGSPMAHSDEASVVRTTRFVPSSTATHAPQRWIDQSHRAAAAGLDALAARLELAAYLVDEPLANLTTHQWIPALRRPALQIRFGLGADYSGPNSDTVRRQFAPPDDPATQRSNQWATVIGELAQPLFDQLPSWPRPGNNIRPGETVRPSGRDDRRASELPLTVVGTAPARRLVRAAQLTDVDLLLLFDIQEKTTRSGALSKSVQFAVWDTWGAREVFKTPRINYLRLRHAEPDPLFRDPIDAAAAEFGEFVREQLRPEPLPAALTAERAAKRIVQLAELQRDNPLPLLSEMKFYRQCGLATAEQLLSGYQNLLGAEAGAALLAGTEEEKRAVLARWVD
jgi:hypothetical protein